MLNESSAECWVKHWKDVKFWRMDMYQSCLNIKRWLVTCILRGWLRKGCHVLGLGNGPMELQKPWRHVKTCGISTSTENMVVDSSERKSVLVSCLSPSPSSSIVWSFYSEWRACHFWELDTWIWQAFIKSSNYWGFTIVCVKFCSHAQMGYQVGKWYSQRKIHDKPKNAL